MSSDTSHPQNRLFAFGYGYTADFLGRALLEKGDWSLSGTTRDTHKRSALRARGIDAYLFTEEKPLGDPLAMLEHHPIKKVMLCIDYMVMIYVVSPH